MRLEPSLNWMLAFVPVAMALEFSHAAAPYIFFTAGLSIVPMAASLVHATEQLAVRTGDAVGGLLNATFGNAPELIIATVALKAGLFVPMATRTGKRECSWLPFICCWD